VNPLLRVARWWLDLPPRRLRSAVETRWLPMSDGVRLATTLVRPVGGSEPSAPVLLVRTAARAHAAPDAGLLLARLVAESGYRVVIQECRGRHASEGRFAPFEDEGRDARETLDWIAAQPWFDGRLGLAGEGYAAFTAWAGAAEAGERIAALVVAFGTRDPYARFHPGGAFAFEDALASALGIGEREAAAPSRLDLARGLAFRPVREADRVAYRRVDWYRDWVDHPERDDYWAARTPALPSPAPPTLLIAGWHDPCLASQLGDYGALLAASGEGGGAAPELVVGPWPTGAALRRRVGRPNSRPVATSLRALLAFLDRHLREAEERAAPVRVFVHGAARWRELPRWPSPDAELRSYYLRSGGRANSLVGDGALRPEPPPKEEPPDRFTHDPADPVPRVRGVGPADQRKVESRADALCYSSAALEGGVEVTGPVRAVLFAASSAPDTDFTAKLVDVAPTGIALGVCDGILRCRRRKGDGAASWLEPDLPVRLEIELGPTSWRFAAGHRIRLEIASASFPRFDVSSNTRAEPGQASAEQCAPARQCIFHDRERASHVTLPIVGA
jgi:putative CocE/NonD family hydrolase